jgi:hypothetical protein
VQTPYGIGAVPPISFDGATLFVQKNGATVREFMYGDTDQAYASNPISILATPLIKTPVDVARLQGTSKRSEQYAVLVNADGTLAIFHSARSEKLAGWTPWATSTGHSFRSVTGIESQLFFCVERDGAFTLEALDVDDTAHCLDGYTTLTGAASVNWNLPARYRSKTVWINTGT